MKETKCILLKSYLKPNCKFNKTWENLDFNETHLENAINELGDFPTVAKIL